MSSKILINDTVISIAGKDKGKIGKVIKIISNKKAIIEGINLKKKHQKPIPERNQLGSILEKEAAIDISNIAIFNKDTNKSDRVGFKIKKGKKIRIFKSNRKVID